MKIKEEFMQKTMVVWVGALLCCLLWGSAFPCIKIGYSLFNIGPKDTGTQILFAGLRFFLAGVFTIIIGSVLEKRLLKPEKGSLKYILNLSVFQTVLQYLFFYMGLANTTGVKASIIEGVSVFMAIIIASVFFHQEKITSQKLIGCIIGFAGVVYVNLDGGSLSGAIKFTGEGFIIISTIAYAISSVLIKDYSKKENPVTLSGYQFVIGGIVLILAGILKGGKLNVITSSGIGILLYLAMLSAVAYTVWGILLKYNPVSKVAVFGFMNPVFGVLLSAFLLQEGSQALGVKSIISLLLVCIGIYIVNKRKKV